MVTPPLTGTILPGITRDVGAARWRADGRARRSRSGRSASTEWQADAASGRLREVFACGTAAVITPIGAVRYPDGEFPSATASRARSPTALRERLVDIQRGRADDPHGWVARVL